MKTRWLCLLAFVLPLISQAGEYSSTLVVQTGHLRESDLIIRNITDLVGKKTCLTFYIRTAGTSPEIRCYDVIKGFAANVRQVGHFKDGDLIVRKVEDTLNGMSCLVAYVSTPGTSPAVDCYSTGPRFKDHLQQSGHLREGDLDIRRISDPGGMKTCLVAHVTTAGTSPSLLCYPSVAKGKGGMQQVSQLKEGDLIVRKIIDDANNKACLVTYVSTAGTSSRLFCFDR